MNATSAGMCHEESSHHWRSFCPMLILPALFVGACIFLNATWNFAFACFPVLLLLTALVSFSYCGRLVLQSDRHVLRKAVLLAGVVIALVMQIVLARSFYFGL
ncbi:MAG: hypothetical protein AAGF10_01340 [Verrucomicrobiota bacterium]